MAVREFDGSDDRITLGSVGTDLANGAYSIVALVKPSVLDSQGALVGLDSSGVLVGSLFKFGTGGGSSGRLGIATSDLAVFATAGDTADEWQILAVSKPAGEFAVRVHRKKLGSGSWTHLATPSTHPDLAGTVDTVVLGAGLASGANVIGCRMAVTAVFPTALSDSDVEAIQTTPTSQFLVDLGAVGLWELNQASTGTAVTDAVGDADQAAIVGTTVVTDDDPSGWTFGVVVTPPLDFSLHLSGGAANADATLSIGGIESSAVVDASLFDDVRNAERVAGLIDYRLIYVRNDDVEEGDVTVYISTQLESGRTIALGIPTEDVDETVTAVANDTTAPAGVSFSAPAVVGSGLSLGVIPAGSSRGLWVRRTVNSGTAVDPTNHAVIALELARTS